MTASSLLSLTCCLLSMLLLPSHCSATATAVRRASSKLPPTPQSAGRPPHDNAAPSNRLLPPRAFLGGCGCRRRRSQRADRILLRPPRIARPSAAALLLPRPAARACPSVGLGCSGGGGGSGSGSSASTPHGEGGEERVAPPSPPSPPSSQEHPEQQDQRTVTILERGPDHVVVAKPPSVVCHHSGWTGSRSKAKRGEEPEVPMLQRVRDAVGRRVNLVHRLDRGASGALLFAYADSDDDVDGDVDDGDGSSRDDDDAAGGDFSTRRKANKARGATAILSEAMASPAATKTYVALVRGEGILHGVDLKTEGWFEVDRPIKNERGVEHDATTRFRFVAGQPADAGTDAARASLVLARPSTGRWHQVRRHLNGLSHPILGDTTHGSSHTNREWKERRDMPGERTFLHLARLQLPPATDDDDAVVPGGIDVRCPLPADMLALLEGQLPAVLKEAEPILRAEGILVRPDPDSPGEVLPFPSPEDMTKGRSTIVPPEEEEEVEILSRGPYHVVVAKPPSVVCHHSAWTGKRNEVRRVYEPTPMLQRVRDAVGRRVNLVHRLDRGASGCLILTFADEDDAAAGSSVSADEGKEAERRGGDNTKRGPTATLMQAMGSSDAMKTYVALVRGDGTLNGEDLTERGWFTVTTPIKDENGKLMEDTSTEFRFVSATNLTEVNGLDPKEEDRAGTTASIVLARPKSGRWHQIRQHLSGVGLRHPILGDTSHGLSRTNRIWREQRGMPKERVCLHLARVQLPPTEYTPDGVLASCPLPKDMTSMLKKFLPQMLEEARPILSEEGIYVP